MNAFEAIETLKKLEEMPQENWNRFAETNEFYEAREALRRTRIDYAHARGMLGNSEVAKFAYRR